jgi:hypothetical protein
MITANQSLIAICARTIIPICSVGGMVFPTAGVNPPTLTIAALALRASAEIKRNLEQMPAN